MSNKPTRRSTLADPTLVKALMPVCGYLETGEVNNLANRIAAIHDHASREHKRAFEECDTCVRNMQEMYHLPAQVSAVALENPNKKRFTQKLGTVMHANAMRRNGHNSKRAENDFYSAAVLFNQHKKAHPELYRNN